MPFDLQVCKMTFMEEKLKLTPPESCPIVCCAKLIGDEWVLLVLRALFRGPQRFDDLQKLTGAATNILTNRLKRLIEAGMVNKVPYQDRPVRYMYQLTPAGMGLFPVLLEMMRYGEDWLKHLGVEPTRLRHSECGKLSKPGQICSECGKPLVLGSVRIDQP